MADPENRAPQSRVSRLATLPVNTWHQELQPEFEQWGSGHPLATEFDRLKTKKGKYFLREDSIELLAYLKNEFATANAEHQNALSALKSELSGRIDALAKDYSSKLASEIKACREQLAESTKKDVAQMSKELREAITEADSKAKEDSKNLDREVEELREAVESVTSSYETFRKQSLNPLMKANETLQGEVKEEMEGIRTSVADLHTNVGSTCSSLEQSVKKDMETMRRDQQKRDIEQDAQAKHVEMQLRQTLETIQRDISAAKKAFSNVSEETVNVAESALDRLRQAKHAKILRLEDDLKMLRSFAAGICTRRVEWRTGDLSEALETCPISPRGGNGGRPASSSADSAGAGLELRRVNSDGSDHHPSTMGSPSSQAKASAVVGAFMTAGSGPSSPNARNKALARGSHPTAFDSNTTMRPSLTTQAGTGTVSARMASPLLAVLSGAELTPGETTEGGYDSLVPDPDDAGAVRVSSPQFDAAGLQSLRLQLKIKLRRARTGSSANEATGGSAAASGAGAAASASASATSSSAAATGTAAAAATGGADGRRTPVVVSDTDPAPLEAFCTLFLMGPPGLRIAFKLNLGATTVQRSHFFDASGICPSGCEAILDEAALRSGNLNISVELLEVTQSIYSFGQPDRTSVKEVDPYAPYPLVLSQHNNFRTLDVVQEQLDYMKSLMSRNVEWNLKHAASLPRTFGPGEAICSRTFSAAGVEGLQLLFYPSGYTGAKEGYCSFYLHCPPGTSLRCWLGVGRHRRDARVAFEASAGLFGRTNFCRYSEALETSTDTLSLTLELDDTNMSLSEMPVDSAASASGTAEPKSPTQRPLTGTSRPNSGNPQLTTPPGTAPALTLAMPGPYQQQQQQQHQLQQQLQHAYGPGLVGPLPPPSAAGPTTVVNSTFTKHRGGGKAVLKEVQQLPSLWTSAVPCNVGELLDGFHTFREPRFKKPISKGSAAAARRMEQAYGTPLPGSAKAQSPSLADRYHMYS